MAKIETGVDVKVSVRISKLLKEELESWRNHPSYQELLEIAIGNWLLNRRYMP